MLKELQARLLYVLMLMQLATFALSFDLPDYLGVLSRQVEVKLPSRHLATILGNYVP